MTTVTICPACGEGISRAGTPDTAALLSLGVDEYALREALRQEAEIVEHMEGRHPLRFRLWRRLGWRWILGRRTELKTAPVIPLDNSR